MNWWKSLTSFPLRIFLVALILRLVPVIAFRDLGIGLTDMFQYDMLARSLVSGLGYRWYAQEDWRELEDIIVSVLPDDYDPRGQLTSFRPPLYPAFLALIYFVVGTGPKRFFLARLVQTVLSASLAPLTYTLACRYFPDKRRVAVLSAWVVALYPLLVIYPLALATENLFFVLMLTSVLVLHRAQSGLGSLDVEGRNLKPWLSFLVRARWFLLAGFLLGLTALTRSVSLAFTGLAILWVGWGLRQWRIAVVMGSVVMVVILPWIIRNSLLHNRLMGIESALGYDLYVGYHPNGSGTIQFPESLELLTILDDAERDKVGLERAWGFIRADPGRFPYLIVRRAGHFFGLERRALTYFYSNNFFGYLPTPLLLALAAVVCLPFVFVSTSAAIGLALIRWQRQTWLLAVLFLGYITPHLLILGEDRFHLTLVPFLSILAAYCWVAGWPAIQARWQTRSGRVALLLAALAILLLCANWGLELWRDADKLAQLFGPQGNQTYFGY